jgi:HPt (histidine-containing phosphotransfer) domain-containing protein
MSESTGEDELFRQLRVEYLAESDARLVALRADIAELRGGGAGAAGAAAAMRSRLHQLAGSGGSYGFPAVSAIAREAEQWLAGAPLPPAIVPRMEEAVARLEAEFGNAKKTMRSEE